MKKVYLLTWVDIPEIIGRKPETYFIEVPVSADKILVIQIGSRFTLARHEGLRRGLYPGLPRTLPGSDDDHLRLTIAQTVESRRILHQHDLLYIMDAISVDLAHHIPIHYIG